MKKQVTDIDEHPVSNIDSGTMDNKSKDEKKVKVFLYQVPEKNGKPKTNISLVVTPIIIRKPWTIETIQKFPQTVFHSSQFKRSEGSYEYNGLLPSSTFVAGQNFRIT